MLNIIKEYHDLLDSDASLENLDRTVVLIEYILGVQWSKQLSLQIAASGLMAEMEEVALFQEQLDNDFKQYFHFYVKYPELGQVQEITSHHAHRVLKVFWTLVFFPQLMERDGFPLKSSYALFLDTCLVLFHQAYFALLPELKTDTPEKKLLLCAFKDFANQLPRETDRYDLLGLYYEAIEDYGQVADCQKKVLRLTHSDAHEFMTVLQTFWSFLVEQEKFREALGVLLETYPRVLRRDLEEFNELILMTFELQAKHYQVLLYQSEKWHQGLEGYAV